MVTTFSIDINRQDSNQLRPLCTCFLRIENEKLKVPNALLDTGATFCTMDYATWKDLGMNELLYSQRKLYFEGKGYNKENIPFAELGFARTTGHVGNGQPIMPYVVRLCQLNLIGVGDQKITLENITVHLLEHCSERFIVGMNVLRYLDHTYATDDLKYTFSFTEQGQRRMLKERRGVSNFFNNLDQPF